MAAFADKAVQEAFRVSGVAACRKFLAHKLPKHRYSLWPDWCLYLGGFYV